MTPVRWLTNAREMTVEILVDDRTQQLVARDIRIARKIHHHDARTTGMHFEIVAGGGIERPCVRLRSRHDGRRQAREVEEPLRLRLFTRLVQIGDDRILLVVDTGRTSVLILNEEFRGSRTVDDRRNLIGHIVLPRGDLPADERTVVIAAGEHEYLAAQFAQRQIGPEIDETVAVGARRIEVVAHARTERRIVARIALPLHLDDAALRRTGRQVTIHRRDGLIERHAGRCPVVDHQIVGTRRTQVEAPHAGAQLRSQTEALTFRPKVERRGRRIVRAGNRQRRKQRIVGQIAHPRSIELPACGVVHSRQRTQLDRIAFAAHERLGATPPCNAGGRHHVDPQSDERALRQHDGNRTATLARGEFHARCSVGLQHPHGHDIRSTVDPAETVGSEIVDERPRQPFGILHGGATLALAETVAGLGSMILCKPDEIVVGMQVSGNHISSAHEGDTVRAVASIVHKGRSSHVWNVDVFTSTAKLVSSIRVVNSILKKG